MGLASAQVIARSHGGLRKILIVDSDSLGRATITRLLRRGLAADVEIVETAVAQEALARIGRCIDPFDCLLLAEGPELNVETFLTQSQDSSGNPPCAIVVLTADTPRDDAVFLRAGAQEVLVRSAVSAASLARSMSHACERFAFASQHRHAGPARNFEANHYHQLFGALDDAFCRIQLIYAEGSPWPIDWLYLEVNASWERHTRISGAVGKRLSDILTGVEPEWFELYGRAAQTGRAQRRQSRVAALDLWVDVLALPFGDPADQEVAVLVREISQQKLAELALRRSEERFRSTFENVAIGMARVNSEGRWLRVNPAVTRITGYSAEDLASQSMFEITIDSDRPKLRAYLATMLEDGHAASALDVRMVRADGSIVWVNFTLSPPQAARNEEVQLVASLEDVTVKKNALEEIERQRSFIERLTHVMPATLYLYDLQTQREVWVNRHIGLQLGYAPLQIVENGSEFLQQHMDPHDWAALRRHLDAVAASTDDAVFSFEYRVRRQDGTWCWFRNNDTVFRRDSQHRAVELVGTATDITERKANEYDIQVALESAETANRAKSDFLSGMSHELRSPLNAILGFAQLLDSGAPVLTTAQRESVQQILKAGWYLLDLINQILDLSRIESGNLVLSSEAVDLHSLMRDCKSMTESLARAQGVHVELSMAAARHVMRSDALRLKQMCINLLSNAIKYNRPGGSVQVSWDHIAPERTRISFADEGWGLSRAEIARLFRPFERLGQENGAIEGTGVGLAVSRRLALLMGGDIAAESVVGVGSVFWIDLPDYEMPAAVRPMTVGRTATFAPDLTEEPTTVLCVEDNPANLLLVERIVARRSNMRLLAARDAEQGLKVAHESVPDVVLMDLNLPGVSGLDAFRALSSDSATVSIPVIAISANAMPQDIQRGLDAGFFRYLTKPIQIGPFNDALDAALRWSRAARLQRRGAPRLS
jgi:PAS domain S-box-containing protein